MDELVLVSKKGNPITTSLLVAKRFGKQHKNVIRDIKTIMEKDSAQNWAQFYHSGSYVDPSGKRNDMFYMNRDGFSLLVMGFTGKEALQFKLDFINAFNQMEAKLKQQQLPQNYLDALKALVASEERRIAIEAEIKQQEPLVHFAKTVQESDSNIDVAMLAQILFKNKKIGRNKLFKILKEEKFLLPNNRPYQKYVDAGYFELALVTTNNNFAVTKVNVTPKGQLYLSNHFKNKVLCSEKAGITS